MYSIWTMDKDSRKLVHMLGGFKSIHEAMEWLTNTYTSEAEFWFHIKEVRILHD